MRTEDVPLEIQPFFEKKRMKYTKYDVARMRFLAGNFVSFVLDLEKFHPRQSCLAEYNQGVFDENESKTDKYKTLSG